jgi:hypothetical protein
MPKNWSVYEPESVYAYLEENDDEIQVGDFIHFQANNQMGNISYEVILDDDGKKGLKKIADYDSIMEEMENNAYDEEEEQKGGKRRRRKTRRHKKSKHGKKSRQHKTKKNRKYRKH